MKELMTTFTISDIILFIILLAVAIKGIVDFYDWSKDRLKKKFDKDNESKSTQMDIDKKFSEDEERIAKLEENQNNILNKLSSLNDKVDTLIESDKDDIKSSLTHDHHYFCDKQGWIDDFSLECAERRFSQYQKEGGNSFIEGFMNDLRALPKRDLSATTKEDFNIHHYN